MEVFVSRLLQPSVNAIHSLAFSDKEDLLAVGLSDGSIQLLCSNTWAVRCVIPGCEGERSVRRLCFVEGRLFSTGVHGQITEWSTDTGKEMGSYPSNGGAIWDMAVDEERRLLAVSTESGAIPM
ncbi:cirrhosis, autosomal recessive 1A (cirhin) [Perkinsus olseni]|uniref:Cirrhosis, autosomal recessive 1A (Cirhin) n=2 Tax=Perkinsus olseni TaxID=32597 RepID=A0A7J6T196_PEROL|nr:cirrhosis, autosomal recessive 1A (cirhin) [Perkinsus olseni]